MKEHKPPCPSCGDKMHDDIVICVNLKCPSNTDFLISELVRALEFYANKKNYEERNGGASYSMVDVEEGAVARRALAYYRKCR